MFDVTVRFRLTKPGEQLLRELFGREQSPVGDIGRTAPTPKRPAATTTAKKRGQKRAKPKAQPQPKSETVRKPSDETLLKVRGAIDKLRSDGMNIVGAQLVSASSGVNINTVYNVLRYLWDQGEIKKHGHGKWKIAIYHRRTRAKHPPVNAALTKLLAEVLKQADRGYTAPELAEALDATLVDVEEQLVGLVSSGVLAQEKDTYSYNRETPDV